jgi:hypothetical protein
MSARETPNHPDFSSGEPEHINGPLCLLPRVEHKTAAIIEERARFAPITAERLATAEEAANTSPRSITSSGKVSLLDARMQAF